MGSLPQNVFYPILFYINTEVYFAFMKQLHCFNNGKWHCWQMKMNLKAIIYWSLNITTPCKFELVKSPFMFNKIRTVTSEAMVKTKKSKSKKNCQIF